ncbi:superfamily IV 4 TMS phage holin [Humibacillus xanthopallidus]|uniref:Superfamily IV 4 TMS phage holin n=1 Tax=Humibacillus xanthopallidus TaxID=412689 RepID=A0A543PN72_9MICO|nr:phage holin family protein [Humibacillus xanthopallidus]TQN45524.1 superfamily IV 4 TMS phage holin [Humibacillus xanthopallidus]
MSSGSKGPVKRPLSVTLVAVVLVLTALLDTLVAYGLIEGRVVGLGRVIDTAAVPADANAQATYEVLGWIFVAIAIAQVVLAVLVARGHNGARLVVTLVIAARQAYSWALLAQFDGQALQGLLSLALSTLILFLLWNRAATAWFERGHEGAVGRATGNPFTEPSRGSGARVFDFIARLTVIALTIVITPGVTVTNSISLVLVVLAIVVAGWLLRPVFVRIAGLFGWAGAVLLALFANAAVIGLAFYLTPGIEVDGFLSVLVASWIYGFAMAALTWLFSINSQDYLTVHAVRMSSAGRRRGRRGDSGGAPEVADGIPGVVFIQLDGVPAPLLENEIRAGNLPTISSWVRSGSHTWTEWRARVPSTTPVSQAGLLHGNNHGIPAFRWWDREAGRLLVANRPADAAVIEERLSDGRGLLADDGVSISNLFSGDAPTSLLTMSGLRQRSTGLGPSSSYAAFFTHPAGLARAVVMTLGEMVKEVFQSRRQERRGVVPRIDRSGSYVALRAVTNVLLRDLNVALVVEAMMRGSRSIYVDFVDYDEIAHHAGVSRPESLASLYGLDDVVRSLHAVAEAGVTPRPYHFVLVSDHGQSQGATFRQRYGLTLEELVRQHLSGSASVAAATQEVEAYGPVNVLIGQLAGQESVTGRLTRRALGARDVSNATGPSAKGSDGPVDGLSEVTPGSGAGRGTHAATATKPGERPAEPPAEQPAEPPDLVVVGSGNLGGIWFAREPERLLVEEIEERHPGLLTALASHEGIAFIVVMAPTGPVAIGPDGSTDLGTGLVRGVDPLAHFDDDARRDFDRVARYDDAPDIYVNSLYDPVLDEVAAFEELVGCHGGIGGWQTRPLLVHPKEWPIDPDLVGPDGRIRGADQVHVQLVRWLERLGHRTDLAAAVVEELASEPDGIPPG